MTYKEAPAKTTIETPVITEEEAERREMLLRAAEIIEECGYTSGSRGMWVTGTKCLLGAVAVAANLPLYEGPGDEPEFYDMDEAALLLPGRPTSSMAFGWSDTQKFPDRISGGGPPDVDLGKRRVSALLRAMANGKTFGEARMIADSGGGL